MAALGNLEPVDARPFAVGRSDDLHDIAIVENMVDGNHLSVDFRAYALVAHIGMNLVREIDGRRTGRKLNDFACRRKDIDLI